MTLTPEQIKEIRERLEIPYSLATDKDDIKILLDEVDRLRDALAFYADREIYIPQIGERFRKAFSDSGQKARDAIGEGE